MFSLQRLFLILRILTFILIVWGAVVRSTGSGLGCPDWPLCHGAIVPHFAWQTYIEWFHRFLAGLVSIATVALWWTIRRDSAARTRLAWRPHVLLGLLGAQVVLGGVTVLTELHAHVVATHMALALLYYGLLLAMAVRVEAPAIAAPAPEAARLVRAGEFVLGLVFVQCVLGALVSASHAGLACPDFPTCLGSWWPGFFGSVALHLTHRIGALLVCVATLAFIGAAWNRPTLAPRGLLIGIFAMLAVQIIVGITNVLLGLPPVTDIAHNACGVALFAMQLLTTQRLKYTR